MWCRFAISYCTADQTFKHNCDISSSVVHWSFQGTKISKSRYKHFRSVLRIRWIGRPLLLIWKNCIIPWTETIVRGDRLICEGKQNFRGFPNFCGFRRINLSENMLWKYWVLKWDSNVWSLLIFFAAHSWVIQYLNIRSRDNENLFFEKLYVASWF